MKRIIFIFCLLFKSQKVSFLIKMEKIREGISENIEDGCNIRKTLD